MSENIVPFGSNPEKPAAPQLNWKAQKHALGKLLSEQAPLNSDQIRQIADLTFGALPPLPRDGLTFEKAILHITSEKGRHLGRAYQRFCAFHLEVYGWDPGQLKIGPGSPGKSWNPRDLVSYRTAYTIWRVKKAYETRQRQIENLKERKTFGENKKSA
jgi:hypothetical protein